MNEPIYHPHIRWPLLPERYDHALHEAVAYVLNRYDPVGLVAAGSILRGKPDPSSDLDLYVIHLAPFRQRVQKYFNQDVPTEIFVNPPAAVRAYFEEEHRAGKPITAHMLVSGHVLLETGPVLSELRRFAAASLYRPMDTSPQALLYTRYLIASRLEDALDVVDKDPATADLLLTQAVGEMLNYLFERAGRFYPRAKDLIEAAGRLDRTAGALASELLQSTDLRRRAELAAHLGDRILAAHGFFEWESQQEPVEDPQ